MKRLLGLLVVLSTLGCPTIRDKSVYQAELNFSDLTVRRSVPAVQRYLATQCTCSDNHWTATAPEVTDLQCGTAADWLVTYHARWAWHQNMVRYNGSLISSDPGPAPTIPPVTCALPEGGQ